MVKQLVADNIEQTDMKDFKELLELTWPENRNCVIIQAVVAMRKLYPDKKAKDIYYEVGCWCKLDEKTIRKICGKK